MFVHNIDPTILSIGGLEIRYYGLVYVVGFLFALWYMLKLSEKKQIGLSKDDVYDFMIWLMIGIFIGSRLGEVIFYNLPYYLQNPLQIFAFWRGGMSFHGGLIGTLVVGYIFVKKKKIDFYEMADALVIPAAFALMLGRITNFINGELYGRITDASWGVKFPGEEGFRHPSQLYEAAKNLIIVGALFVLKSKKRKKGFLFWSFVTLYGLFRTLIEFYREPTMLYFGVPTGQLFSFIMFLIGGYVLLTKYRKK